ncbi:hypothetical protein [Mycobacterium sp. IDR2000157661]|uniref:hypothetical protein n=1 Tax=Mycobacterium sp. IDR2000157661 TaxID=2867005 RepID=UPI001EE9CB7B|nr:hypothetical protein [Mycobacterium sp. IDR2000157661]ULE31789.1 hypothetical protein K3G64_16530 [Mycobacterium sp. IDR2000157661]
MKFSRVCARPRPVTLLSVASATAIVVGTLLPTAVPVAAQPPLPAPLHNVKYTVFAEQPFFVDIYYRDVDPPNWAAYSHNPYQFSPKVEAQVGPDQQWNLDVQLANPDDWALVTATSGPGEENPNVHCVLAVDGVVVKTHQGPKGALCSLRSW